MGTINVPALQLFRRGVTQTGGEGESFGESIPCSLGSTTWLWRNLLEKYFVDTGLSQKDSASASTREGVAVNGSEVCLGLWGGAGLGRTAGLGPGAPGSPWLCLLISSLLTPENPQRRFILSSQEHFLEMCAFPTVFQAFIQTAWPSPRTQDMVKLLNPKSLSYPRDLLRPLWAIPAVSPDLRAALPAPDQAGSPSPSPELEQLRAAPSLRQGCPGTAGPELCCHFQG